jgi:hypothetical protein
LRDGKLYGCNYAGYASVAGLTAETAGDYYDLGTFSGEKKAELVEFRLGFNERGYMEFCKKCAGYGNNSHPVKAAEQL